MVDDSRAPLDLRPFELLRDGWLLAQPHYFTLLTVFAVGALLAGVFIHLPVIGLIALFLTFATCNSGVCWYLLRAYQARGPTVATLLEPMQEQPTQVLLLHGAAGLCMALGALLSWILGPVLGAFVLLLPSICVCLLLWATLPGMLFERTTVVVAVARAWAMMQPQLGDFVLLGVSLGVVNAIAAATLLGALFCVPATCGALTLVSARALRIGQVLA